MSEFSKFELDPAILASLEKMGFLQPSDIQSETIPLILRGNDLIALAQTGSGKTAACAIPICQIVDTAKTVIQALIIAPTRELAMQYASEVQKVGKLKGVKAFAICGGEDASLQLSKIKHGVQVLVATPGRLIDFIYSRQIDLTNVATLVLDEADEMLSMGFYEDLEFIINCLTHPHQTLLFSATMPNQIRAIAKTHMKDPVEISLIKTDATPKALEHRFLYCKHREREASLIKLLLDLQPHQSLIFCKSRVDCEALSRALKSHFDGVDFLHAGLSQDIRSMITNKFRSKRIRFLIATDVASRGLDFSSVSHVFIYHLSDDPDLYLHRSGRTGRFDKAGVVVTLVTDKEMRTLKEVLTILKAEANWIGNPPPPKEEEHSRPKRPRRPPPRPRVSH